jgi:leucyl aminopeptidase
MILMKKDMGGAALALALARMLMGATRPCSCAADSRVENSVSGRRTARATCCVRAQGLTVEIGNTDAEGGWCSPTHWPRRTARARAAHRPRDAHGRRARGAGARAAGYLLESAGARDAAAAHRRTGSGPDVADAAVGGYDEDLASRVADLNNVATHAFAGSIVAALFLKRFVTRSRNWLHGDVYAWNSKERPGRPVGGDPHVVRALYRLIRQRFG